MNVTMLSRRLLFIVAFVVTMGCLAWLVQGESSPLSQYFFEHGSLANLWTILNLPALLVGIMISGNVHQASAAAYFLAFVAQWTALGGLLSLLVVRPRPNPR